MFESIINKLFGTDEQQYKEPSHINFGRYVNGYKTQSVYDAWDEARKLFSERRYLEAYEKFFEYLKWFKAGEAKDNIKFERFSNEIIFEIIQGSSIIHGRADSEKLIAYSNFAKVKKPSIPVFRKLLEKNFHYTYSRFYLSEENTIGMKIRLENDKIEPNKIWTPLRELALNSDMEDDLFLDDFSSIEEIEVTHLEHCSDSEKEIKYRYFKKWIREFKEKISTFDSHNFSGAIAFHCLTLILRIDYLINPQGKLEQDNVDFVGFYFADDGKSTEEKNVKMLQLIDEMDSISKENFLSSLSYPNLTFSPVGYSTYQEVEDFLLDDIAKIGWYKDNGYEDVMSIIYEYGALYALFRYGMHESMRDLLHIFIKVIHSEYLKELDFTPLYENGEFEKAIINSEIKKVIDFWRPVYNNFYDFTSKIDYSSLNKFCDSYLNLIANLDYRS